MYCGECAHSSVYNKLDPSGYLHTAGTFPQQIEELRALVDILHAEQRLKEMSPLGDLSLPKKAFFSLSCTAQSRVALRLSFSHNESSMQSSNS